MCMIIVSIASSNSGRLSLKEEAVDNGMAEWVIVDKRGATEFRWKTELTNGISDVSNISSVGGVINDE